MARIGLDVLDCALVAILVVVVQDVIAVICTKLFLNLRSKCTYLITLDNDSANFGLEKVGAINSIVTRLVEKVEQALLAKYIGFILMSRPSLGDKRKILGSHMTDIVAPIKAL